MKPAEQPTAEFDDACTPVAAAGERSSTNAVAAIAVSVVVPVRDDATRLKQCLASLADQSLPREQYEIIVIDNGSCDDSLVVARHVADRIIEAPGVKVGAVRNRGVAAAQGAILAMVDSDHEVPRNWLEAGIAAFEASADTAMIGYPYLAPEQGTWVQRTWQLQRIGDGKRKPARWLAAGNIFVRRKAFLAVKGFREDLTASEDVDLCVRMAAAGYGLMCEPTIANVHYGEPATLAQFFRKECWRGASGVRSFIAQGAPIRELPSLLFPLYHLMAFLILIASVIGTTLGWLHYGTVFAGLALLLLPSLLLAVRTAIRSGHLSAVLPLVPLYLTYGLARAWVLVAGDRNYRRATSAVNGAARHPGAQL